MGALSKPLLICTTARSGSNLLSDYLNNTRCFGDIGEFFNPNLVQSGWRGKKFEYRTDVDVRDYVAFLQKCHSSLTGSWGIKCLYEDIENLISFEVVQSLLKNATLIFLRRRDKVAQAVSYFLAQKTGKWMHGDIGVRDATAVEFDYEKIDRALNMLLSQECQWLTIFSHFGLSPTEIVYEDFVTDPARYVQMIGLSAGLGRTIASVRTTLVPQTNEVNRLFAEQFVTQRLGESVFAKTQPVKYGDVIFVER